jgi:hypothetical protein
VAAAAACTKNEGILFLIVLALSRLIANILGRRISGARRELLTFGIGASIGLITLGIFKLLIVPPNDALVPISFQQFLDRITDGKRNFFVMSGIRDSFNFGQWILSPLPFMAVHAALSWKASHSLRRVPWFTPAFIIIAMICGIYVAILLSSYDVESHIQSSFDRILLQLWPSIVILYSLLSAPRGYAATPWKLTGALACRVLAVIVAIASVCAWSLIGKHPESKKLPKPHIALSRTEVFSGETYTMKITGIADPQVYVSFTLNGKAMGQFGAYIGTNGVVDFQVSPSTWKGTYRFLAVRPSVSPEWINFENDAEITVK